MANEFKDDITIDRNNLEIELEKQGSLYKKWSDRFADAKWERDKAEERYDLARGDIELLIRTKPKKYMERNEDVEKITEAVIEILVMRQKNVMEAKREWDEAKKNANYLETSVKAMEHRRSSLKYLSELWTGGYWSTDMRMKERKARMDIKDQNEGLKDNPRIARRRNK